MRTGELDSGGFLVEPEIYSGGLTGLERLRFITLSMPMAIANAIAEYTNDAECAQAVTHPEAPQCRAASPE
jgi:hypothetical protein